MASTAARNDALGQLQSRAQIELIDSVDRLRSMGYQGELDLPQLIVCGDTSSGKSSVLEAVSRIKFPAASTLCTRFATELILRKAAVPKFDVYLVADPSRPEEEQAHVLSFQAPGQDITEEDFASIVQAAAEHMNELGHQEFHEDRLVATVHGPNVPSLTLVDLPGLIRTSSEDTQSCNIDVVRKITDTYMGYRNSTILAVLAAGNNMMNQEVLEIARLYDKGGERTIGIITKPDKVDPGSDEERYWIETAKNNKKHLALGWHVLKNRSYDQLQVGPAERDALEARFFQDSHWCAVPAGSRGVASLRDRLAAVLDRSVRGSLPNLARDVETRLARCKENIKNLGEPKTTDSERQQHLIAISVDLSAVIKESIEGRYNGTFYHSASAEINAARKVRSQLQHAMQDFCKTMKGRGHLISYADKRDSRLPNYCSNIDFSIAASLYTDQSSRKDMTIQDLLSSVKRYMDANQGCDLPGLGLSQAVVHFFKVQSKPWETIAHGFIETCWALIRTFFNEALRHTSPPHICNAILQHCDEDLERLRTDALLKVDELLKPYRRGYAITSRFAEMKSIMAKVKESDIDKELSSAATAWSYVEVYYKLACETFTETIVTLVVENRLVDSLLELFTATKVSALTSEDLQFLSAEPAEVATARRVNAENLKCFQAIQATFRKHTGPFSASTALPVTHIDDTRVPTPGRENENPGAFATPQPASRSPEAAAQIHSGDIEKQAMERVLAPPINIITPPISPAQDPFGKRPSKQNIDAGTKSYSGQQTPSSRNVFTEYALSGDEAEVGPYAKALKKVRDGTSPTPRRKVWVASSGHFNPAVESVDDEA